MKKTRVFQNVKNTRIVSSTFVRYLGTVLLFLFLLPYIITTLFHNIGGEDQETIGWSGQGDIFIENITAAGSEKIPLEIYLTDKLSRAISKEYEPEALKAQAVLIRTAVVEQLWAKNGVAKGELTLQDEEYGHGKITDAFAEAVYSTAGVYLTYQGKPAKAPYFAVSNGQTRQGAEVLGQEEYPYLVSVICGRDFLAEKYSGKVSMEKSEFIEAWEKAAGKPLEGEFDLNKMTVNRDTSGYVTRITYENNVLSGEECRTIWRLDSACFQIEEENQKINFTVKGVGHGLGMSQFAANEMAKGESDYIEILEYFFPDTQLSKFE